VSGSTLLIQIILLIGVAVVSALLTRSTAGARHQAIRRLFLGMFIVAAVTSIVFPQWLSRVANLVGVGRGTDLLLYALVIAFLSYISTSHRRMNRMSRQITRLTRELTLAEARGAALARRSPTPQELRAAERDGPEDRRTGQPTGEK
jgi:small membrane protein